MNKKNFIFNQKKEIKFIHVPKNRIKKKQKIEFWRFSKKKTIIQDEKQYFRKKILILSKKLKKKIKEKF